MMELSFNKL